MKFGICTSADNAAWAHKAGFDYIELPLNAIGALDDAGFASAEQNLCDAHIQAERFNLLFPKTLHVLGPDADTAVTEKWLRTAFGRMKKLGGKTAVFGSGKSRTIPAGMLFRQGFDQLVSAVQLTGNIAAEYGIQIAIEPLNRSETNIINTVTEGEMLAYCVNLPNVGVLADWYHMFLENEPADHIYLVKNILHTHIAQGTDRRYPSGDGSQVAVFFEALKKAGYDGTMSIEGRTENIQKDGEEALALMKKLASCGEIK